MVGRVDNNVSTAQVAISIERATVDKEVQRVAPTKVVNSNEEKQSSVNQEMPTEQAKTMVESMNKFLMSAQSQLKFVFHDELNEYYVTIIDSQTDEVIREIPSKKLMDIHAAMREFVGLLVDRKI